MAACKVCGELKDTPHSCTVYTAQFLDQTRKKEGLGTTYTTRYGDIEKHTSDVCRRCYIKWNFVLPLAVYLVSAVLIKIILLPNEGWGAVPPLALIPAGVIVWKYVSLPRRLLREALRQRSGFGQHKGWTSWEYQLLSAEKQNRPPKS